MAPKSKALRASAALNQHPETVRDPAFAESDFFDARDLVQVKYEMLRRRRVDGLPVSEVARAFGVSRQTFYTSQAAFEKNGIPGLLPLRRGPKGAHKCTDEILDFAEAWMAEHPGQGKVNLTEAIQKQFGIRLHPRSIARALTRRKKKRQAEPQQGS